MKKVACVTGGASGLGFVVVEKLLEEGYEVIATSRSERKIKEASEALRSEKVTFIRGDITKPKVLEEVYRFILEKYGYVNVLVNNIGRMSGGGIENISTEQWETMFDVNVHAPFRITKRMLSLLKRAEYGCIVNVSSIASQITGGCMAYSACKAALDMMTKSWAKELAKYYIRVNSVNPGLMNTGFQVNSQIVGLSEYEDFLQQSADAYPMGTGTPADVANLICYLVSQKGRWITGSNYIIDGGRSVNL